MQIIAAQYATPYWHVKELSLQST